MNDLQMNIDTCYRHLEFIEDFLEEYDEMYGLGAIKDCPDYDEAIAVLRNTLHGIIKENR